MDTKKEPVAPRHEDTPSSEPKHNPDTPAQNNSQNDRTSSRVPNT